MHTNAVSTDGREMPLLTVISETLKYIADKAIEKLTEQVTTPSFKPTNSPSSKDWKGSPSQNPMGPHSPCLVERRTQAIHEKGHEGGRDHQRGVVA